jgi:outer membrane biosynthesis protein TonB
MDHFTFEQRTGYSALDAAAVNALAKWRFAKAGKCHIPTIPFTFTLKHRH